MTRDEIIAKWAGLSARERDVWVAEVVFGHSVGRERRIGGEVFISDVNAPHGFQRAVPRYTTEISAAWTVLDTFPYATIDTAPDCVEVLLWNDNGHQSSAEQSKAPDAICLAALIAKLTEVSADVAV